MKTCRRRKDVPMTPNPALNVHWHNESVATDMVSSDTLVIDSGITVSQFFVGCNVCDVYGIKTDKQFINTLEDNIHDVVPPISSSVTVPK